MKKFLGYAILLLPLVGSIVASVALNGWLDTAIWTGVVIAVLVCVGFGGNMIEEARAAAL